MSDIQELKKLLGDYTTKVDDKLSTLITTIQSANSNPTAALLKVSKEVEVLFPKLADRLRSLVLGVPQGTCELSSIILRDVKLTHTPQGTILFYCENPIALEELPIYLDRNRPLEDQGVFFTNKNITRGVTIHMAIKHVISFYGNESIDHLRFFVYDG